MTKAEILVQETSLEPSRIQDLQIPGRVGAGQFSARAADRNLISQAPEGFLDTTHFDTVRFPPPAWSHTVFAAASSDGEKAYSPYRGSEVVLERLAESVGAFLGVPLDPKRQLIVTPGTQAGLFAALGSIVERGARVALVNPEYLFSERILGFFGAEVAPIDLELDSPDGPTPDLQTLEHEFSQRGTRTLVFSHPNNPTGSVYSARTISRLAALCVKYDVTVVADELYSRLLHDGQAFNHMAGQPGMAERTVTLLGPSKTESLSGYRLGIVVAPPEIIDRMENVQSIVSLRAPAYAQHLLVHWLVDDVDWLQERLVDFTALRTMTAEQFGRLPWLKWSPGMGTAYAWPDVSALGMSAYDVAEALITQAGVLVSPGYQFGPGNEGRFRVCYARDEETWRAGLGRMVTVLDVLAKQRGLPERTS